ncbi:MAG: M23 family metallopeptidase [Elusimicrobia bacterium]|nr:M23 family metallopeptidase [Elusimicrobiota bacterium]
MVLIRHGDKGFTRYAHLQKITVQQGKSVHQGETVGFVGKSGRATGYHLHFEILTAEHKTLDPLPFLFPEAKSVHFAGPSTPALPSSVNRDSPVGTGLPSTVSGTEFSNPPGRKCSVN